MLSLHLRVEVFFVHFLPKKLDTQVVDDQALTAAAADICKSLIISHLKMSF